MVTGGGRMNRGPPRGRRLPQSRIPQSDVVTLDQGDDASGIGFAPVGVDRLGFHAIGVPPIESTTVVGRKQASPGRTTHDAPTLIRHGLPPLGMLSTAHERDVARWPLRTE
jgi:hypothetical protein